MPKIIFFFLIIFFQTTFAYAYIDPFTGAFILKAIAALFASIIFYLRVCCNTVILSMSCHCGSYFVEKQKRFVYAFSFEFYQETLSFYFVKGSIYISQVKTYLFALLKRQKAKYTSALPPSHYS